MEKKVRRDEGQFGEKWDMCVWEWLSKGFRSCRLSLNICIHFFVL